jgi:hypothetical protein
MFNVVGGSADGGWRMAVKGTAPNGRDGLLRSTHHSLVIRHFIGLNGGASRCRKPDTPG